MRFKVLTRNGWIVWPETAYDIITIGIVTIVLMQSAAKFFPAGSVRLVKNTTN